MNYTFQFIKICCMKGENFEKLPIKKNTKKSFISKKNAYPVSFSEGIETQLALAPGYKLSKSETDILSFLPDALAPPICCKKQ